MIETEMAAPADPRRDALERWCVEALGGQGLNLAVASTDASARRYFRVWAGGVSYIAMDAPDQFEALRAFIHVAEMMEHAGLHVPRLHARDLDRGFLLLSDLGRETYLEAFTREGFPATPGERPSPPLVGPARRFDAAIEQLLLWQAATREGALPEYSTDLLQAELELFPAWYLERHLGERPTPAQRRRLERVFDSVVTRVGEQPRVFVHRDYMPRNLMVSDPGPGVIDFQDAVIGPVTYDAVSLFQDAFISWPEGFVHDGLRRYWEGARRAGVPVDTDFDRFLTECRWMGVQRHLKVLGIFARLRYRDGKPGYLQDAPRFIAYLRAAMDADPELAETLAPLSPWLHGGEV